MTDYLSRRNALLGIGTAGGSAGLALLTGSSVALASGTSQTFPPGNILNFGADPTGNQDSSPAFAAAIAALWNSTTG